MDQQLIDQIYEASFVPEMWPGVLGTFAGLADAHGGHLFTTDAGASSVRWAASDSLQARMQVMVGGNWLQRGQRLVRLLGAQRAGFVTEHDVYTDAELGEDPFYRDLLWRCGLGWGAGMAVRLPTQDTLVFCVERTRDRGPVEREVVQRLDGYYPHLARSVLMTARLQLERAAVASETLALIGLPALVFGSGAKVLISNHLVEAQADHIRWLARDRIALKDPVANALLQGALATPEQDGCKPPRSFPLRDEDGRAALIAHVVPVRGASSDIFVRCENVVILTPVTPAEGPPCELVTSLFDLTPAEARVARSLVAGKTLHHIAADSGITHNTVRTQVRGALQKTGCRRQAELVALLSGISIFRAS